MPPAVVQSAVLTARDDARGGLHLVSLTVEAAVAHAYTTPGQYIQLHAPSGAGYFVLASNVGEQPFELLVKNHGGAADALASSPLGTTFGIDGPLGAGFPVARMRGRHVVVAVVASALGVARSVVALRIAEGAAAATHVFIGLRAPSDVPIPEEVRDWTERGISVVLCLSGSARLRRAIGEGSARLALSELHHHAEVLPKAHRVAGYVQHALIRALEAKEVPHGTLVVAAGPEEMLADMRSLGESTQFPSGPSIEVLTNV